MSSKDESTREEARGDGGEGKSGERGANVNFHGGFAAGEMKNEVVDWSRCESNKTRRSSSDSEAARAILVLYANRVKRACNAEDRVSSTRCSVERAGTNPEFYKDVPKAARARESQGKEGGSARETKGTAGCSDFSLLVKATTEGSVESTSSKSKGYRAIYPFRARITTIGIFYAATRHLMKKIYSIIDATRFFYKQLRSALNFYHQPTRRRTR